MDRTNCTLHILWDNLLEYSISSQCLLQDSLLTCLKCLVIIS
jgi:hypothetical protein